MSDYGDPIWGVDVPPPIRRKRDGDAIAFFILLAAGCLTMGAVSATWSAWTYGDSYPWGPLLVIGSQAFLVVLVGLLGTYLRAGHHHVAWLGALGALAGVAAFVIENFLLLAYLPCPSFC
jgi:hypothetical protein